MKDNLPQPFPLLPDGTAYRKHRWLAVATRTICDKRGLWGQKLDLELCSSAVDWRLGMQRGNNLFLAERTPRATELEKPLGQQLRNALGLANTGLEQGLLQLLEITSKRVF